MKQIIKTILIITFLLAPSAGFALNVAPNINTSNTSVGAATVTNTGSGYIISAPWSANLISNLVNWLIGVLAILAALGVAIGGVIWITAAGNQGQIKEAKSWITSSLFGLALGLSAHFLLTTINPELGYANFITIGHIEPADPGDYDFTSTTAYNNSPYGGGGAGQRLNLPNGNFPAPTSTNINDIVDFYLNNVTVMYVKADDPALHQKRDRVYGGVPYSDCSAFAARIASVAGLNKIDGEGTTKGLFINGHNNRQRLPQNISDLDQILTPGDVVGYNDGNIGHVLTYIGNGELIECGGQSGNSVKKKNGDIKVVDMVKRLNMYKNENAYYIKR